MTFTPKLIENRLNLKVSLIQYRHFQSFLFVLVVYSFFFFFSRQIFVVTRQVALKTVIVFANAKMNCDVTNIRLGKTNRFFGGNYRASKAKTSFQKYEWCCGVPRVIGFNQRFFQNSG